MTLSKEQFSELRQVGLSIDQINKFEEGWKPQKHDKGFWEQIKDTGKTLWEDLKKTKDTVNTEIDKDTSPMGFLKGVTSATWQSLGSGGKAISGVGGALLETADDLTGEVVSNAAENVTAKIMSTDIGKQAASKIMESEESWQNFQEENPLLADNISAAFGLAEGVGTMMGAPGALKSVGHAGRFAKDIIKRGANAVPGVTKTANVISGAKDIVKETLRDADVFKNGVSKFSGLNPETVQLILKKTGEFTEAQLDNLDRKAIADSVWGKVTDRIKNIAETGKKYQAIRESGSNVELAKDWFGDVLKGLGFDIKNGLIKTTTKSATRNPNDLTALQQVYKTWGDKTEMGADEFLNLRQDLAELAKFDKISGKTSASEKIAKQLRAELNKKGRDQIDGLKKLDADFAPEIKELSAIKKEFFTKDGGLKDTAINRIVNATGKGKDNLLNRLKKIDPSIEERIQLVKALEDVALSKGQKVGTYTHTLLSGGLSASTFLVNPALGFTTYLLTQPGMFVRYLKWMGTKWPKHKRAVKNITHKIKNGVRLNKDEKELVQNALKPSDDIRDAFLFQASSNQDSEE